MLSTHLDVDLYRLFKRIKETILQLGIGMFCGTIRD